MKDNEISYSKFCFPSPEPDKDIYRDKLKKCDRLRLEGRTLIFLKGKDVISRQEVTRKDFAPEYPFLIQFFS